MTLISLVTEPSAGPLDRIRNNFMAPALGATIIDCIGNLITILFFEE